MPGLNASPFDSLPSVGLWTNLFHEQDPAWSAGGLGAAESAGWRVLWIPESRVGREAFTLAQDLLGRSQEMKIATGVANLWFRDPWAVAKTQEFFAERFGDRFLLGIGVGHKGVTGRSTREWKAPAELMTDYLGRVDRVAGRDESQQRHSRVIAALGPQMLGVARGQAAGALSYLAPVSHTSRARQALGPEPFLGVTLKVVLGDGDAAWRVARESIAGPLALRNYRSHLRRMGYAAEDLDSVSSLVVNDLVAVGDTRAISGRVREHLDAGATHVALEVLAASPRDTIDVWQELAHLTTPQ